MAPSVRRSQAGAATGARTQQPPLHPLTGCLPPETGSYDWTRHRGPHTYLCLDPQHCAMASSTQTCLDHTEDLQGWGISSACLF